MATDDVLRRTANEIGQRIRRSRTGAGLTLSVLAAKSELSEGFLSKLERGQASSSIANLIVITGILGMELHELFSGQASQTRTKVSVHQRASETAFSEVESTGYRWRLLAGGAVLDQIEVFQLVFPARNRMDTMVSHPGQEHCYVLRGEIIFHVGADRHRLRAGEGIFIESELPHRAENIGRGEAHVLMTVTRPGAAETGPPVPVADWWRLAAADPPRGDDPRPPAERRRAKQPSPG